MGGEQRNVNPFRNPPMLKDEGLESSTWTDAFMSWSQENIVILVFIFLVSVYFLFPRWRPWFITGERSEQDIQRLNEQRRAAYEQRQQHMDDLTKHLPRPANSTTSAKVAETDSIKDDSVEEKSEQQLQEEAYERLQRRLDEQNRTSKAPRPSVIPPARPMPRSTHNIVTGQELFSTGSTCGPNGCG